MARKRRLSEKKVLGPKGPIDWYMLISVLLLSCIGIIMVLSASSAVTAANNANKVYYFFNKQLVSLVIGLVGLIAASRFDYFKLKDYTVPAFIITIILLIAVLFSSPVNGARSWINLGGFKFQPSELVKILMVIILARILSQKQPKLHSLYDGLAPVLLIIGVICGLILLEKDLGSTMAVALTAFIMLFAAGASTRHLSTLGLTGFLLAVVAIFSEEYRLKRVMSLFNPWADKAGTGFQIIQSLFAIGSGGFFGVGLGKSLQKYKYLPEQHTDFIFSILAEETGFIGCALVIILFAFFAARAYRIAKNTPDSFGSLLACGLTSMIMVEALMNIAVATASMPVTGVTLPFISYGGSSLMFKLTGVGILLNISRYSREPAKIIKISRSKKGLINGVGE